MIAVAHQFSSCSSQSEQQPEAWRFVPDTILPGYQWAPQWVPARTPTVHWSPISGKAVGGPCDQTAQYTVQKHPKQGSGAMSVQGQSARRALSVARRSKRTTTTDAEMFDDFRVHTCGTRGTSIVCEMSDVIQESVILDSRRRTSTEIRYVKT